jgi:hypothetical protein
VYSRVGLDDEQSGEEKHLHEPATRKQQQQHSVVVLSKSWGVYTQGTIKQPPHPIEKQASTSNDQQHKHSSIACWLMHRGITCLEYCMAVS